MKKYREILGISQMALAEEIGCSTTFIGNIEINRRFPSADNINRIAKALNVKVADLFAEQEPEIIKKMASKRDFKLRLGKVMDKAIDDLFG
jgi:transcriptional regulator with XRE-family HTH domain